MNHSSPFKGGSGMNTSKLINIAYGPLQFLTANMAEPIRDCIHLVCELIRILTRKAIPLNNKTEVIDRASTILSKLGQVLHERDHTIMLHLTLHCIEQQYDFGQVEMRLFERGQHVIKENVNSYTNPEANFGNNYTHSIGGHTQLKLIEDLVDALTPGNLKKESKKNNIVYYLTDLVYYLLYSIHFCIA